MAVRTTAAKKHEFVISSAQPVTSDRVEAPIRTCVGCRQKAVATELLRVVAMPAASRTPGSDDADVLVVPDVRRRAAGRGAWVHRDRKCVEQAQRRRAFARALRISGARGLDSSAVADYVATTSVL